MSAGLVGIEDKHLQLKLTVLVTIVDPEPNQHDTHITILNRVLDAVMPHPDSAIATNKSGEMVSAIATDWEFTS